MINLKLIFENNSILKDFISSRYSMFYNIEEVWENKLMTDKLLKHYIFNAAKNNLSEKEIIALKELESQRALFNTKKTIKSTEHIDKLSEKNAGLNKVIDDSLSREMDEIFKKDNISRFVELIKENNLSLLSEDRDNANMLLMSSKYNAVKIALYLIKSGVDVDSLDSFNNTALLWACSQQTPNFMFIKTLLFFNASTGIRNLSGITALAMSLNKSNFNISDLLIEFGASIDTTDNNGNTPMHRAIMSKNRLVIGYLLKSGANLQIANKNETTALRLVSNIKELHDLFYDELKKDKGSDYLSTRNRLR